MLKEYTKEYEELSTKRQNYISHRCKCEANDETTTDESGLD
jgi:inosine/xanthosine triphosphate pyrophosphatase family protein